LYCWGEGDLGQLFSAGDSSVPRKAEGDFVWSAVAASSNDTCALRAAGEVYCAGSTFGPSAVLTGVSSIHAYDTSEGEFYYAIVGGKIRRFNATTVPEDDGAEASWMTISPGHGHRCAIRTDGSLACAGDNYDGELGDGTVAPSPTYKTVGLATDWAQVGTGFAHTCGLRNGGELYCWGLNNSGQLGLGTSWSVYPVPVEP
jgi:alpha-tubulin suppressor-like RCC1 family protein